METEIIKSFTFDKIHNDKQRIFKCWGSVEVKDRHNEIIPAEEVYKIMDIWMDRGSPIQYNHTNRKVGVGLNWQPLEKNGKPGVLITAKIYDHYEEDDDIWNGIKKGEIEGLSIGGKSYDREVTEKGTYLRGLIGYEFSVVNRCGNQEATFETVNMLAKSEKKMVKNNIQKEENLVVEETPVTESPEDFKGEAMALFAKISERLDAIEEKISGGNSEEEPVEEQKAEEEEPKEEEKAEEETKEEEEEKEDLKKSMVEMKKEIMDLKKSIVKEVVKTERHNEYKNTGVDVMKNINAKVENMAKTGKMNFAAVGAEIRKAQNAELAKKFNQ